MPKYEEAHRASWVRGMVEAKVLIRRLGEERLIPALPMDIGPSQRISVQTASHPPTFRPRLDRG